MTFYNIITSEIVPGKPDHWNKALKCSIVKKILNKTIKEINLRLDTFPKLDG